jgi:hypothetical protein
LSVLRARRLSGEVKGNDTNHVGVIDPMGIPVGENNKLIESIYFEIG